MLCEGAFMPALRGDYSRTIEAIDKIANTCEAVAQLLLLTRPQLDIKVQEGLRQIMDTTVLCFKPLMEMFNSLGKSSACANMPYWNSEIVSVSGVRAVEIPTRAMVVVMRARAPRG